MIDGYVLPRDVHTIYADGKQSHVPLLAGWNADEVRSGVVLAKEKPTAAGFTERTRTQFGADAEAVLAAYPASSDAEALESAASLGSDLFIAYATWKWLELQRQTGGGPVYRYRFDRKIPIAPDTKVNGVVATANDIGARHAGEIEYVFGALDSVPKVTWDEADRRLSDLMMSYWSNFARSADPNGPGLPKWPGYDKANGDPVMHLDVGVRCQTRDRPCTLRGARRVRREGAGAVDGPARLAAGGRGLEPITRTSARSRRSLEHRTTDGDAGGTRDWLQSPASSPLTERVIPRLLRYIPPPCTFNRSTGSLPPSPS